MSQKTKAKKSVTITITIAIILFTYSTWEDYPTKYKDSLRQIVQERMQVIIALIEENQNGRGASIEEVLSEAAVRGIDREQAFNDIQHLKFEGYVYEPKNGEIRYAF